MDVFESRFTTGQVLRAVGVANPTLQTWIRRGLIVGQRADGPAVDMPGQAGHRRTFSFFAVMQIAVANAILGVSGRTARAFEAAIEFAHLGDQQRAPSVPFPEGQTWLLVSDETELLVNVTPGHSPFLSATWPGSSTPSAVIAVDVGSIFDRVCAALGAHPQAVIEANTGPVDPEWAEGELIE